MTFCGSKFPASMFVRYAGKFDLLLFTILLSKLLSVLFQLPSQCNSGLLVDPQPIHISQWGDACNYSAFVAFQLPVLKLTIQYYGDYANQQKKLRELNSFQINATDGKGVNTPVNHTFVPLGYEKLICQSPRTALMCDEGKEKCVCLHLDFPAISNEAALKGSKKGPPVIAVRTVEYNMPFTMHDPIKLDPEKRLLRDGSSNDDDLDRSTSSNSTEVKDGVLTEKESQHDSLRKNNNSLNSEASQRRRRRTSGSESKNEDISSRENIEDVKFVYTRCLAKWDTFCGPPFVHCMPYLGIGNRKTIACVYGTCSLSPRLSADCNTVFVPLLLILRLLFTSLL